MDIYDRQVGVCSLWLALRKAPRSPTAAFYAMDGMYSGFAGLEIAPAFPAYTPSMA